MSERSPEETEVSAQHVSSGEQAHHIEFFSRPAIPSDETLLQTLLTVRQQIGQFLERLGAEKDVGVSEARKAAILHSALDAIITIDQNGRILEWNPAAERLFGYSRSEVMGQPMVYLIIPPGLRERHNRSLARYLETGQTTLLDQHVEMTAMRSDGLLFPVELAITRIALPGPALFTAYLRDLTERKHAEAEREHLLWLEQQSRQQALARTRELEAILEAIADGVMVFNRDGKLVQMNTMAQTLFTFSNHVGVSSYPFQNQALLLPEAQWPLKRVLSGEVLTGQFTPDVVLQNSDGSEYLCNVSGSPILDDFGVPAGAVLVVRNVTERRHLERRTREALEGSSALAGALRLSEARLREQANILAKHSSDLEHTNYELQCQRDELTLVNAALQEANRVRSQFLATMTHELCTPLALIIGFSQLILERAPDAGWDLQQQTHQERILTNAQNLLALINDVLDLTKIEAGRMEITSTHVDVSALLTSVVEEYQSIADSRHLILRSAIGDGVDVLESDAKKLRRILVSLVSNALKFTERGEVTVSVIRANADYLVFAVQDTGIGIPTGLQERIFEAFYQIDGSYTRKYEGVGLGLSHADQLARLLGGEIEVMSVPGHGSTFSLILPIKATYQPGKQKFPHK